MSDSFGGLLESFQLSLEVEGKADKTVSNYSTAVEAFATWLRANHRTDDVHQVTADQVRRWLASLRGNVAHSTVYRNYSGTRQFFAWAVREGVLDASPMASVRAPKVPEQAPSVLTDDQIKALVRDCQGKDFTPRRDAAIILLFLDTGIRLSELAGLTVDDVDIRLRRAAVLGKGHRPRVVSFGARTAQALDRYLRERRKHDRSENPQLWLAEKNRPPMTPNGIAQMLRRRGKNVGVRNLHAHAFRHYFADSWLKSGGSEIDLQELAGWRSPQMIRRYAAANRAERARQAHRQLSPADRLL